MALFKVPLTRRDSLFEDPFFADVWEDFEALKKEIWSENRSFLSSGRNSEFWPTSRFSIFPQRRWFFPENFMDEDFKFLPQLKDEILKGM